LSSPGLVQSSSWLVHELSSPRVDQSASWQSASWRIRELSSNWGTTVINYIMLGGSFVCVRLLPEKEGEFDLCVEFVCMGKIDRPLSVLCMCFS